MKSYVLQPLSEQARAAFDGFTHWAKIKVADLTVTAAATAQTFSLGKIPKGACALVETDLWTPFKDASDNAFNDCAITIGDDDTANSLLTSTQLNENGTEVLFKRGSLSNPYTAEKNMILTFNSMTGKALADLDVGLLFILAKIIDIRALTTVFAANIATQE